MASQNRRTWDPNDTRYQRVAERKLQIMRAAQRVFIRNGYERASMDAIASEAGVSKMTLYRQFSDKESLFIDCMNEQCRDMLIEENYSVASTLEEAEQFLINYANVVVDLITRSDIVMLYRMLVGETNHFSELGDKFYLSAPNQAVTVIQKILARLFDPHQARLRAQAFFWASLGDTYERVVLGVLKAEDAKELFGDQIRLAASIVLR